MSISLNFYFLKILYNLIKHKVNCSSSSTLQKYHRSTHIKPFGSLLLPNLTTTISKTIVFIILTTSQHHSSSHCIWWISQQNCHENTCIAHHPSFNSWLSLLFKGIIYSKISRSKDSYSNEWDQCSSVYSP